MWHIEYNQVKRYWHRKLLKQELWEIFSIENQTCQPLPGRIFLLNEMLNLNVWQGGLVVRIITCIFSVIGSNLISSLCSWWVSSGSPGSLPQSKGMHCRLISVFSDCSPKVPRIDSKSLHKKSGTDNGWMSLNNML